MHFAPEIDHPVLKALFRHWVAARGDHLMPEPGAIDLSALPPDVRRHAVVYACEPAAPAAGDCPRFRLVKVGEQARERYGADAEGRFVDEVVRAHDLDVLTRVLESVRRDRVVHCYRTMITLAGGGAVPRAKLLLPLGTPDGVVTGVLGGLIQTQAPDQGTLDDTYHSRFVALDALEDRPEHFR
ncbi:hypothetical protein C882_0390 [Caenispirillum salinarum AK4]|uniref:PAS domain-containing protein n=1 Tax=Caenispirillum salinarum AK4 TaxID=1238182 RepID=K9HGI4_9PROT|nr:hypothetical protein [Caenispirillum salinarum]EKV29568.1 hypothetical protein C882_0390 [Caenispirillum salinarum AK4]